MLDASILGKALAQNATLRSDPRYAFVDRLSELVIPEAVSGRVFDLPGKQRVVAVSYGQLLFRLRPPSARADEVSSALPTRSSNAPSPENSVSVYAPSGRGSKFAVNRSRMGS